MVASGSFTLPDGDKATLGDLSNVSDIVDTGTLNKSVPKIDDWTKTSRFVLLSMKDALRGPTKVAWGWIIDSVVGLGDQIFGAPPKPASPQDTLDTV